MLCLVTQPNTKVLEVQLDSKSNGHDCIEKVCHQLGIVECDYFGLKYTNDKGEQLWLNLRNDITRQVTPPFRLRLRVKFYLEPHYLLQEATRHQFYLNIRDDIVGGQLLPPENSDDTQMAKTTALLIQAEYGDLPVNVDVDKYNKRYGILLDSMQDSTAVTKAHAKLRGMKKVAAEHKLFKEVSTWPCYGVAYHAIKAVSGSVCQPAVPVEDAKWLGVGPLGISLHDDNHLLIKAVVYSAIHMATLTRKCLFLEIVCDNGTTTILDLTLSSQRAAGSLYRCVTEMYSFYLCDTVRSSVASQYSRDFKGTLAALFNENTSLGKSYIFDIRRTFREAYDYSRRRLYNVEVIKNKKRMDKALSRVTSLDGCDKTEETSGCSNSDTVDDSMTCRVCMDRRIDCAFCPCGHVACCMPCAGQLDTCPLCRTQVANRQVVFLPGGPTDSVSTCGSGEREAPTTSASCSSSASSSSSSSSSSSASSSATSASTSTSSPARSTRIRSRHCQSRSRTSSPRS